MVRACVSLTFIAALASCTDSTGITGPAVSADRLFVGDNTLTMDDKFANANAAFQYFEEDTKGTLTPGKQADLVILTENPLHLPPETLLEIAVVETISRGKTVYPPATDLV